MNKDQIKAILAQENLSPQKAKGQNFLIDSELSKKIVGFLAPHYEHVIEIGPGLGSLTMHLLLKAEHLKVIELDRGYVRFLKDSYTNLEIYEQDFLKYTVPRETTSVISNIPYYITTKIIEKVILETPNLKSFVFMTQKDVSDRLFATPNTKEYGPLAIIINLTGNIEFKVTVTADKFYPTPNVNSAVFRFLRKEVNFDLKEFYAFVKYTFINRRKTMMKNLKQKYDETAIKDGYSALNIREDIRVEALAPATILALYETLRDKGLQ